MNDIDRIDTYRRRREHADVFRAINDQIQSRFEAKYISYPEDAEFIESLIRLTQSKRVLELGTYTGFTTLHMIRGVYPDGLCVSVDRVKLLTEFFDTDAIRQCFRFVIGSTPEIISTLGPEVFDLVYIDSDHGQEHTENERLALWSITRPGTVFIYHDCQKITYCGHSGPIYRYLMDLVNAGVYQGAIFPSKDRLDIMDMMGVNYHRDMLPHLGVFIRR